MLLKLQMMRNAMYEGYYMFDSFKYQIIPKKSQVARYPLWAVGAGDAAAAMRSAARLSRMLPVAAHADLRRGGVRVDIGCCTPPRGRAWSPAQRCRADALLL
ncbi:hypothetical protein ABZP36_027280 [Zizania latifolia]